MDGHTFLSWNIPNTITIWLMVALGAGIAILAMKQWQNMQGGN